MSSRAATLNLRVGGVYHVTEALDLRQGTSTVVLPVDTSIRVIGQSSKSVNVRVIVPGEGSFSGTLTLDSAAHLVASS